MPEHWLHRRWCEILGLDPKISKEVDRVIDRREAHDIIKRVCNVGYLCVFLPMVLRGKLDPIPLFKSIKRGYPPELAHTLDKHKMALLTWREIYDNFGREGLEAAIYHIALDYIEDCTLQRFSKEEAKKRLERRLAFLLECLDEEGFVEASKIEQKLHEHFDDIYEEILRICSVDRYRARRRTQS